MRWPLFVLATPFPGVAEAKLYEDTWKGHILTEHPEMQGHLEAVKSTVQQPLVVCNATTAGNYTFVSSSEVDEKGKPLIVVVTGEAAKDPFVVATSYFGSKLYLDLTQEKWPIQWVKK